MVAGFGEFLPDCGGGGWPRDIYVQIAVLMLSRKTDGAGCSGDLFDCIYDPRRRRVAHAGLPAAQDDGTDDEGQGYWKPEN
jgi:hypothetical protein